MKFLSAICLVVLAAACNPNASDEVNPHLDSLYVDSCPDPTQPSVHYLSQEAAECATILFRCDAGQSPLSDECGCGCIDTGAACCERADEPGTGNNPACFEGATCRADGTWQCNNGAGQSVCEADGTVCITSHAGQ